MSEGVLSGVNCPDRGEDRSWRCILYIYKSRRLITEEGVNMTAHLHFRDNTIIITSAVHLTSASSPTHGRRQGEVWSNLYIRCTDVRA